MDQYFFAAIHRKEQENGHHYMKLHSRAFPAVGPEDVLVKMEAINICTTDYQQWMGLRDHKPFPFADGHEFTGVIAAMGERVGAGFAIGDRVGRIETGCGYCEACRLGKESACKNITVFPEDNEGFTGHKSFANYCVIPFQQLIVMSKEIPAAEAAFLEPVATSVSAIRKANISAGETVVIVGGGTMGLVNAQVAKAFGARVIITELSPKKIQRAKQMGIAEVIDAKNTYPIQAVQAATAGKGADAVLVAVGASNAYEQGYAMLKDSEGKLIIFVAGYPAPKIDLDPNQIHYSKSEIIGAYAANESDFVISARLLSNKMIDVSFSLEGEVFALREIDAAFAAAATPDMYRITIDLQDV